VLFISCEDRADILHWRLKHSCDFIGLHIEELAGSLEILDLVGHDSILFERDPRSGAARVASSYARLAERIREIGAELVILDGVADVFGANENARGEVKQFINALLALISAERGAVLLVAHVSKPTALASVSTEGYSGSTAWHNAVRARWFLYPETEPSDDGGLSRPVRTGTLLLELQKSNYGATDQVIRFRWDEVAHLFVGQGAGGVGPVQRATQELQEKAAILAAGRDVTAKGLVVPAVRGGFNTAYHVLSVNSLFPASLKRKDKATRDRFWRLVREMLNDGVIREASYQGSGRHRHVCLMFP
jgi:RecA-family ATPase